jgi:hypothetical protein
VGSVTGDKIEPAIYAADFENAVIEKVIAIRFGTAARASPSSRRLNA